MLWQTEKETGDKESISMWGTYVTRKLTTEIFLYLQTDMLKEHYQRQQRW